MSDQVADIVRKGYERFNAGDIEYVLSHVDPDVEWRDSSDVPGGRIHRGIDEVRPFLESFFRVWESPRFEVEEVESRPGRSLVFVTFHGKGRQSGAEVDAPIAHVHEWRNGRVHRATTFFDRAEARAAFEGDGEASAGG
jgi:ketosteroid isomerase-like protein